MARTNWTIEDCIRHNEEAGVLLTKQMIERQLLRTKLQEMLAVEEENIHELSSAITMNKAQTAALKDAANLLNP